MLILFVCKVTKDQTFSWKVLADGSLWRTAEKDDRSQSSISHLLLDYASILIVRTWHVLYRPWSLCYRPIYLKSGVCHSLGTTHTFACAASHLLAILSSYDLHGSECRLLEQSAASSAGLRCNCSLLGMESDGLHLFPVGRYNSYNPSRGPQWWIWTFFIVWVFSAYFLT